MIFQISASGGPGSRPVSGLEPIHLDLILLVLRVHGQAVLQQRFAPEVRAIRGGDQLLAARLPRPQDGAQKGPGGPALATRVAKGPGKEDLQGGSDFLPSLRTTQRPTP